MAVSVISISERSAVINVVPEQPVVNIVSGFAFGGSSDVTGANVGAGAGVFKQKVGGVLQFKSLLQGTNINIATGTDTLTISAAVSGLASVLGVSNDADNISIINLGAPLLPSSAARLQDIPTSLPPSGIAGGDLDGSYPNPSLAPIPTLSAGTYGDSANYPVFTVDSKGRIINASELPLPSSFAPTGPAGGDLTGTYPNPTITNSAVSYQKIQNVTGNRLLGRVGADGIVQEITLGTGLTFSGTQLNIATPTEINWLIGGNAVTDVEELGTTTNFDLPIIVNSIERARFKTSGVVQLLSTTQDDTLSRLMVQDSNGNIYYRDVSSLPNSLDSWDYNGNTVTSEKSIGTIDNFDFPIITNNVEIARFSTDGTLGLGMNPASTSRLDVLGINSGNILRLRDSGNTTDMFKVSNTGVITMTQPAQDNTNTRILTVDASTGVIEYRDAATLGGSSLTDGDKGDITVTSGGTVWSIDNGVVTYAKIQDITGQRILGRYAASTGPAQEITIGSGLSLDTSTGVLTASTISAEFIEDTIGAILTDTATIDLTYSDATPSITADVIDNSISNNKFRQSAGLSVVGVSGNSTANVADITASVDNTVLRRSGTSIGFGSLNLNYLGSYTEGSVLFAGASGALSQDNAELFYDNTNKVLGIGTNTPDPLSKLEVKGDGVGYIARFLGTDGAYRFSLTDTGRLEHVSHQAASNAVFSIENRLGGTGTQHMLFRIFNYDPTTKYTGTGPVLVLGYNASGLALVSGATNALSHTGTSLAFLNQSGPNNAAQFIFNPAQTTTGGKTVDILGGVTANGGGATSSSLRVAPTLNYTGGSGHTFRGIYYNPTLTSLTGTTHIALETVSGQVRLGGITQDDTKTRILAIDSTTNQLFWRASSSLGGGGGGTPSLTATQVGYGDGSNLLTGEPAFTYDATNNKLTVDRIGLPGQSTEPAGAVSNGDIYYDSTILDHRARINGLWSNLTRPTSTTIDVTSSPYTVTEADRNTIIYVDTSAGDVDIDISPDLSVDWTCTFINDGSGNVNIVPGGSTFIGVDTVCSTQYGWFTLTYRGGLTYYGAGALGTSGISVLDVANGGTGLTSLPANRIPYGNGTSPFGHESGFEYDPSVNTMIVPIARVTDSIRSAASANAEVLVRGTRLTIHNQLTSETINIIPAAATPTIQANKVATGGQFQIKASFGNSTDVEGDDLIVEAGSAYQTTGNGSGGDLYLRSGDKRTAGAGSEGSVFIRGEAIGVSSTVYGGGRLALLPRTGGFVNAGTATNLWTETLAAGTNSLSMYTERAVATDASAASTHSLRVTINGTEYDILLKVV